MISSPFPTVPETLFSCHNQEYIKFIGQMLGREAALEATLHLLQDWGLVELSDYRFDAPTSPGRLPRKTARPLSR